jgi:DNA gyrase/topoisomerase IV subunit A
MDKEQLQQDIDAMREKLAEMEAKLQEKKKEKKYFIPELGETYWFIRSDGTTIMSFLNYGSLDDKNYIDSGNCYASEEDAEKAVAKQKAYVRIVRELRDHEEEGEDCDSFIYYLNAAHGYAISLCSSYTLMMFGSHIKKMFSTYDACKWVIDNMKDDLKIYFGE